MDTSPIWPDGPPGSQALRVVPQQTPVPCFLIARVPRIPTVATGRSACDQVLHGTHLPNPTQASQRQPVIQPVQASEHGLQTCCSRPSVVK